MACKKCNDSGFVLMERIAAPPKGDKELFPKELYIGFRYGFRCDCPKQCAQWVPSYHNADSRYFNFAHAELHKTKSGQNGRP